MVQGIYLDLRHTHAHARTHKYAQAQADTHARTDARTDARERDERAREKDFGPFKYVNNRKHTFAV